MDSPQVDAGSIERRLRPVDYLVLGLLCLVLYGFTLLNPRLLNAHETAHCLNVSEMFTTGDWFIPTYGGRPWLERPPLPHWMTAAAVYLSGDMVVERSYRIGSIVIATLTVLIFAWAVAGCLGRTTGLMSGAIFATMREYVAYAVAPEADIFLACTVTIAGSLALRALLDPVAKETRTSFVGLRSSTLFIFFILLGAMNAMKGPLFGMFFVVPPIVAFAAWSRGIGSIRPLIWLWGWLITLVVGLAWPIAAYLRFPDIVDLWAVDYGVRWNKGYIGEPFWYYFVSQPWSFFPWTVPALVGLCLTAKSVYRNESPCLRFLWCWALVPMVFFTAFKGKHHHYLLSCLAPAAVLSVFGAYRVWEWIRALPGWVRSPWLSLPVLGLPVGISLYWFYDKIPGSDALKIGLLCSWLALSAICWWVLGHRNYRVAFWGIIAVVVVGNCAIFEYRTRYLEDYRDDLALLQKVQELATGDQPVFVLGENDVLNPSWHLFYLKGKAKILHNETFLRDDRIDKSEVYLICRPRDEAKLIWYGSLALVEQSRRTRFERSSADRYSLYLLKFHPNLERVPGDIRMSPNQATGREDGPYLHGPARSTAWRPQ